MEKKKAFVELIKGNDALIFKVTTIYSQDQEDQKDLYQEIVYQLWKSFDRFRNEAKLSTWLYRIALNTSITHLKKGKKIGQKVSIDQVIMKQIEQTDTVMEDRIVLLYAHIKTLNKIEKGLILLFLEGNNYEEISKITGFSSTNVGTKLSRIKQKLKVQMKN